MNYLSNRLAPWIDPRVLSVRVDQLQSYLLHHGWHPVASPRPQFLWFEKATDDAGEPPLLVIPATERSSDSIQRIIDAVANLALVEDRYAGAVLTDILQEAASGQPPGPARQDGAPVTVASGVTDRKP